jgi:hypothetical protein
MTAVASGMAAVDGYAAIGRRSTTTLTGSTDIHARIVRVVHGRKGARSTVRAGLVLGGPRVRRRPRLATGCEQNRCQGEEDVSHGSPAIKRPLHIPARARHTNALRPRGPETPTLATSRARVSKPGQGSICFFSSSEHRSGHAFENVETNGFGHLRADLNADRRDALWKQCRFVRRCPSRSAFFAAC